MTRREYKTQWQRNKRHAQQSAGMCVDCNVPVVRFKRCLKHRRIVAEAVRRCSHG